MQVDLPAEIQEEGSYRQFEKSGRPDWDFEHNHVQDPGLFGDFHPTNYSDDTVVECYSVWALAYVTGISKSQVSLALQRCIDVGLAFDLFDNETLDTHWVWMGSTITINEDGAMIHSISFAEQKKPRELA